MSAVKDHKNVSLLSKVPEVFEIEYDFDKDAGAVGALDLFTAKNAIMVHRAWVKVKTAVTSGGAATVSAGKTGDLTGLVAAAALSDINTANKVVFGAAAATNDTSFVLAADGKVEMDIGTAALTAGKLVFCFEASLI